MSALLRSLLSVRSDWPALKRSHLLHFILSLAGYTVPECSFANRQEIATARRDEDRHRSSAAMAIEEANKQGGECDSCANQ